MSLALVPVEISSRLKGLAGNDKNFWTPDKIRFLTKYPNWAIATDSLIATRNYDVAISFAASIFLRSFEFSAELTETELQRIHHITSTLLLQMFDKADRWNEYVMWFWFLRKHTNNYLRYDLHIVQHHDPDIDLFIDDKGDQYTWVHTMYLYNHRRRIIERKLQRSKDGKASKSDKHRSKDDLTATDLRCRLENVFSYYRFKFEQEAFWQSFWKK